MFYSSQTECNTQERRPPSSNGTESSSFLRIQNLREANDGPFLAEEVVYVVRKDVQTTPSNYRNVEPTKLSREEPRKAYEVNPGAR